MTTMGRSTDEIGRAYKAAKAAFRRFPGQCLVLARTMLGLEYGVYPDAAAAWAKTEHRIPGTNFEKAPAGSYIYYTGGSNGHGHIAWVSKPDGDGHPMVWTNCDWPSSAGTGAVGHVRLSVMEAHYSNLKRAGIAWDCDGVAASNAPIWDAPKKTTTKKAA